MRTPPASRKSAYTPPVRALLALAFVLSCASREPPAPPAPAAEVLVRPDSLVLAAGASSQLAVQVNDASGSPVGGADLCFTSSDPSVAQVSAWGLVSAPGKVGSASIVVSSGGRSAKVAISIEAGAPNRVEKAGGDAQSGLGGSALREPLRVRVADAQGNPVPGAAITFHADSGNVEPAEVRTAPDGTATATWILGNAIGPQGVSAICAGIRATFHALARPGAPARIVQVGAPPEGAVAGGVIAVQSLVTDAHGNPVATSRVSWSVFRGDGAANPGIAVTDARGISSSSWTTGTAAGRNELRAAIAAAPESSAEFVVDTVPGPPARVVATRGQSQRGRSGVAVQIEPVARVTDTAGNPIAGLAVHFSVTAGGGDLEHATATTGADGDASPGKWKLGAKGLNSLEASADGMKATVIFSARAR